VVVSDLLPTLAVAVVLTLAVVAAVYMRRRRFWVWVDDEATNRAVILDCITSRQSDVVATRTSSLVTDTQVVSPPDNNQSVVNTAM